MIVITNEPGEECLDLVSSLNPRVDVGKNFCLLYVKVSQYYCLETLAWLFNLT
jgi:hypothetical protein